MNEIDNRRIIGAYMNIEEKEVKGMRRIEGDIQKVTDSDIKDLIAAQGIPYIDIGNSPKTVRYRGPSGEIIDEVVSSGEPGESWTLTVDEEAVANREYAKRNDEFLKRAEEGRVQVLHIFD